MARADLLKKLFSSFKVEDREAFLRVAEEIIEDERIADFFRLKINIICYI